MRRSEKQITDSAEIDDIIRRCEVCRMAMVDADGSPYVVPLNFGYENRTLYFHSAREGRKIDILRANNKVCVEFCPDHELSLGDGACECTEKYRSVIAFGRAFIVDDDPGKRRGYDVLMRHYKTGPFEYKEKSLVKSLIIRVEIDGMTGKMSGF